MSNTIDSRSDREICCDIIEREIQEIVDDATTSIGDSAFFYCTKLTSVDFPAVTSIASSAFRSCTKLTSVILRGTEKVCGLSATSAFTNTPIASGTGYVYVPDELVDDYKAATNWSFYADQIKPISELEDET